MATEERARPDHLTHLARLSGSPQTHHLFHAMRVIEAAYADRPRHGRARRPSTDPVRFGQVPELAFPTSTIDGFEPPGEDAPGRLTNRFFGLFGPHGPLPIHLTEYARDRLRNHRDPTMVAFADMLTHRLTQLLYRSWAAGQPAPSFDRVGEDPIEDMVAAIAGYRGTSFDDRDAMPDLAKRHFAGRLGHGAQNAEGLLAVVSAFFRAPVEIEQFVGSWLALEPDDRWQLGKPAALGATTSLGDRVWSRASKFRLRIGPLGFDDYCRLLPGSASLERLSAIVRNYVGDVLEWDLNLVLCADEVPQSALGADTRLGQTSWLGTRADHSDADDLHLAGDVMAFGQEGRTG
ncbi:type VI secretion system baseplate subunit TssG [Qingshengfaniella alkalisoli]|uniref:Type VI secretion system baseplate subunit TssG n=1 Tax=Qingshengfaniella alkalisoli TaxID=2599296 RepID=A0A5B8J9A8_9RHOB|nr:type VI secretion system baseplate subunit TssG [Qingshengfaniella alkalisoli]QDY70927.1 type VI secretion system baseplate subunit TssG [Qingshengfaniella alkalisoli]